MRVNQELEILGGLRWESFDEVGLGEVGGGGGGGGVPDVPPPLLQTCPPFPLLPPDSPCLSVDWKQLFISTSLPLDMHLVQIFRDFLCDAKI